MGVYLFMDIMPNHIKEDDWGRVYEETLKLIRAFPFMDHYVDEETFGCRWHYVDRAKETEMNVDLFEPPQLGWHVFGDMTSLQGAESFMLIRDLQYYRKKSNGAGNCDDILGVLIERETESLEMGLDSAVDEVNVFGNKTQGFPFHIPLLAIACLIESRFPQHAMVRGDISHAQMQEAIQWANRHLDVPIGMPERMDHVHLLKRIQRLVPDDKLALTAFLPLCNQKVDGKLGAFIRSHFDRETILDYFTDRFARFEVGVIGFEMDLQDFIHLGFHLEDACDICVLAEDRCKYDAEKFAESVLDLDWEKDDGESVPLSINEPDKKEPETVDSLLGKFILKGFGEKDPVKPSLTYHDVVEILQEKVGHLCDITKLVSERTEAKQALFNKSNQEYDESEKLFNERIEKFLADYAREKQAGPPPYDVTELGGLITWKKGDTMDPDLEKILKQTKEKVHTSSMLDDPKFKQTFKTMPLNYKMDYLTKNNTSFYIRKQAWDYIINHANDYDVFIVYGTILTMDADQLHINILFKALVNNPALMEMHIL